MERIQITISSVLNDLANSMTREEIRDKYSLTNAQLKQLFQHPQLKGRKTKKVEVMFELIDDVTKEVTPKLTQKVVSEITNPVEEVEELTETTIENSTLAAFE